MADLPGACADEGPIRLSVIIPVRNDAGALARLLDELCGPVRAGGGEVIVVDGGSADGSAAVAAAAGCRVLRSAAGRGRQIAAGAQAARGSWLWILHADSREPDAALGFLLGCDSRPAWGRFDVRFDAPDARLRVVAWMMNHRSRLTGICTGDQGMFVHADLLRRAGGVPLQPLMEDIELSCRLRRLAAPVARHERITTSARRWLQRGVLRTILAMWGFRLRYWFGADPERLAREYYR
ncbi:MAG: TIGR04283 family arsenosugar biosynthesis glycosyltransferase [Pseudomonadales bacterium]